jgi:hypothetical protein
MIWFKYTLLFDVEVLHDFYASGRSADFLFQPTESCKAVLKRHNLVFRSKDTGFDIFSQVDLHKEGLKMKTPLKDNEKFTFLMKLKNPFFVNFSELSLEPGSGSIYFFNNRTNNIKNGQPLLVSDKTSKSVTDADILKMTGRYYRIDLADNSNKVTGEIRSLDSGQRIEAEGSGKKGLFNFNIDTKPLPEGRAEFRLHDSIKDQFYLAHSSVKEDFFGIVEIFYEKGMPAAYRFMQADSAITPRHYGIRFKSRATIWRYILNKKGKDDFPETISIGKKITPAIHFTRDVNPGPDRMVFFSDAPLKFSQKPVTGIRLVNSEADGEEKVVIANLPNPSASLIKKEGDKIFADILIHI